MNAYAVEALADILAEIDGKNPLDVSPVTGRQWRDVYRAPATKVIERLPKPTPEVVAPEGIALSRDEHKLLCDVLKTALQHIPTKVPRGKNPHPAHVATIKALNLLKAKQ